MALTASFSESSCSAFGSTLTGWLCLSSSVFVRSDEGYGWRCSSSDIGVYVIENQIIVYIVGYCCESECLLDSVVTVCMDEMSVAVRIHSKMERTG